jgi:hypothetical protein
VNLDLSKFKKVASDKRCTTLRHEKGHEIKIAHSGLTPKMKAELDGIEMCKGGKVARMAEGGHAPLGGRQVMDDDSPADTDDQAPDDATSDIPDDTSMPSDNIVGPATLAAQQSEPNAGSAMPPKPDNIPSGGEVDVVGQRPMPPPPPTPQQYNADDAAFAQDLALGKITPETYESLFAKKDTLGQMGTLFGLLVSGAGSGLAHQPNAVLDMMNRIIDRDLDAQKASNINAQHWYQLQMQHELQQQATIPQAQATIAGQMAGAYQSVTTADLERAKLKRVGGIDTSASDAAKNNMMIAFRQYQQNIINRLPPVSAKQTAQNTLDNVVTPAITAQVVANNVKRAAIKQMTSPKPPLKGAPGQMQQPGGPGNAINYQKLNQMIQQSRTDAAVGIPPREGELNESDIGNIQKEATQVEDNRVTARAYDHAFKQLWNAADKGSINQEAYKAEINTLSAQIARETAGRFNLSEAQQQTGGMFPNFRDYVSGAGQEKYNNTMNYFKGNEAGTATLNRFPSLKTPFPAFDSPFQEKTQKVVKMKGPDGSMRNVPESSVKKYLNRPGFQVVP